MVDERVRTNPEAFNLISFRVDSFVARNLWDTKAACDPVTAKDQETNRRRAETKSPTWVLFRAYVRPVILP